MLPGHRYHYSKYLFDGQWDLDKHCARCWALGCAIIDAGRAHGDFAPVFDPTFACGTSWEGAFGARPPADVEALAFAIAEDFSVA